MPIIPLDHLAHLARIELTEEEQETLQPQMERILEYVSKLQTVDTSHVSPAAYVTDAVNVCRTDEVMNCDPDVLARCLDAFPDKEGRLLKVQGVFEEDEEAE